MTTGLAVRGLRAGYGPTDVVRGVDLDARPGEVVGLFGANGAGKTTTLNAIVDPALRRGGEIDVDGIALGGSRSGPLAAARRGLALVPEDRCLFRQLTVSENLSVASVRGGPSIDEVLEHFPKLAPLLRRKAGLLSGGEQQMLAIARAMISAPTVLLIDELSLGLAPIIVSQLLASLRKLADGGIAVVLVEQHVNLALGTVDRGYVLRRGEVVLAADAGELIVHGESLSEAYLGDHAAGRG